MSLLPLKKFQRQYFASFTLEAGGKYKLINHSSDQRVSQIQTNASEAQDFDISSLDENGSVQHVSQNYYATSQ